MSNLETDVVVIGSGPGGYVAGIRLGQLGKRVVVVEREQAGGVCLNVGCIPSKALISAAKTFEKVRHAETMGILIDGARVDMPRLQAWKSEVVSKLTGGVGQLLKAAGAQLVMGEARVVSATEVEVRGKEGVQSIRAGAIIVATGSRPVSIPGFAIDNERILDSTGALALASVPPRLLVVGGGYIGIELGIMYAKLGSQVTVVEFLPGLLTGNDPELVQVVARKMKKLGITVYLSSKAKGWRLAGGGEAGRDPGQGGGLVVTVEAVGTGEGAGATREIGCERVLVTVGRRPNSDGLGLAEAGVAIDRHGFVTVDQQQRTSVPGIYAIGDVAGQPMLAHKASKEAEVAAAVIAGHPAAMDTTVIPAVIFSDPEIATVGLSQHDAERAGHVVRVGKYPFGGLGRAMTQGETDGFVKLVADAGSGQLLGVHIVGPGASDLVSEGALALEMGAYLPDIALTVHPHPTLGEAVMEAAKAALGESPHLVGGGQRRGGGRAS